MNREVHFFDLDNTLWSIDSKIWIIDKDKPHVPLIKLSEQEFYLVQNGLYIKDNLTIDYNGQKYSISKNIFERINKVKHITDINRLGISFTEFYSDDYINNNKIEFLLDNIKHLQGTDALVCILTGRSNRKRHANVLNELRIQLKSLGLEIFKIYFVSEFLHMRHTDSISLNKVNVLLEHLIGLEIQDNKFQPLKQDAFDKVYFYDDEIRNIQYANDIQLFFERTMKNSNDELYKIAMERIKNNKLTLITNLITNNEVNPFNTKEIILREPNRYPLKESFIIKTFDKFNAE